MKHILFNISGGLGKNIMATAVIRAIKKAYPDSHITVSSPHRDVWLSNPNVDEIVNLETTPNLVEGHIAGKDSLVFRHDPYLAEDFIHRKKHLTEVWCDLCKVPWDGVKPELYFTKRENDFVKNMLGIKDEPESTKKKEKKTIRRPLFFIQNSGGAASQKYPISWARDLPIPLAERIVAKMNQLGYRSIHLRRYNQPEIKGTEYINLSHRQALAAIQYSDKRLFIDSFAQHAAAAFQLPSAVTWVVNSPKVFGYGLHENIHARAKEQFRHFPDSYLDKYDITGDPTQNPYDTNELFDGEEIMDWLLK